MAINHISVKKRGFISRSKKGWAMALSLFACASIPVYSSAIDGIGQNTHNHQDAHPGADASFISNQGQWEDPSWYQASLPGMRVFVESQGFAFLKYDEDHMAELHEMQGKGAKATVGPMRHHAFRIRFVEGNAMAHEGRARRAHYHNYYIGKDPERWKSKVPLYEGIRLKEVYENVDVEVKLKQGSLKYDIIISPHADPAVVQISYDGVDKVELLQNKLILHTSLGTVEESIPLAYQEIDGKTIRVKCRYTMKNGVVGFDFPEGYNLHCPIVIDPELIAATFSGTTSGSNYGHGAAYDLEGNIYAYARSLGSAQYPATTGAFQTEPGSGTSNAVISKLNPNGSDLIWASFLGGNGEEWPHSLVTNQAGEAHLFGTTSSTDFPVTSAAFQSENGGEIDIFVTHFNAEGSALVGSTYLGGSGIDGWNTTTTGAWENYRGEIMVDGSNHIYIASATSSQDVPTTAGVLQTELLGSSDGLVAKFNANLSNLVWCTLLGGEGNDHSSSLRIHPISGNVTVVGSTESADFPMPPGGFQEEKSMGRDAYILEINSTGDQMVYGTFFGGQGNESGYFLDGNMLGWTIFGSSDGEISASEEAYDGGGDNFICRFNHSFSELLGCAMIGAEQAGVPRAFMMDPCGRTFFSMTSGNSNNFITPDALFQQGSFYLGYLEADMSELGFATLEWVFMPKEAPADLTPTVSFIKAFVL